MSASKENPSDALFQEAQAASRTYQYIIKPDPCGGFVGNVVELPFVLGKGETAQECLLSVEKEVTHVVVMMLRRNQLPPASGGYRRNAQINVRVLPEEKLAFDSVARQEGYRSTSDFLRKLGLEFIRRLNFGH